MTVECHVILLGRFKGWLNVLTINPASVLQLCWVLYSLRPFCICDWYLVLEGVVKVVLTHLPHSHVLFSTQPFFFLNDLYMISVLTIWSCPCVESSLVLLEEGVFLWPVYSVDIILLTFALLHSVLQCQFCLLNQVSLDFLFFHSSSL